MAFKTLTGEEDLVYAMRRNLIEPTVFVLSVDKAGRPNGMAAGWNMKCSYEPPTMAVAVLKTDNTHRLIQESSEFVIAVPTPELREQLEYFGSVHGDVVDKFKKTGIRTLPGTKGKTPLLADARINFECKLHSSAQPADHVIFFGTILAAHYDQSKDQLFYKGRNNAGDRVFDATPDTQ